MTIRNWRILPWLATATLLLSACSSAPGPGSTPAPEPGGDSLTGPVIEQRWNLLLVGTNERLSMPGTPFFEISRDGSVRGHDGCNRFTGEAKLGDNQRIEISELSTTRMACPKMGDAEKVTDMLETAYRYLIDHDRLVFFGPDSRVLGGWRESN